MKAGSENTNRLAVASRVSGKLYQSSPAGSESAQTLVKIKQYLCIKSVGGGRYGSVYKCINTDKKQDFALKEFKKSNIIESFSVNNPLVKSMLNFNHPNIAKVHEIIQEPNCDYTYFVMDYLSGKYGRSIEYQLQKMDRGFEEIVALYYFK